MFQAEAGGDNTASVSITKSVNSDMADSYAGEQGKEKGSGQPAKNRSKQGWYG